MSPQSINQNALCKCSKSGEVVSVTITADEYEYLCQLTGRENDIKGYGDDCKEMEYDDFLNLIAKAQVVEWNKK